MTGCTFGMEEMFSLSKILQMLGNSNDDDYYCLQYDSDSANINGEDSLKNFLLVTGSVGFMAFVQSCILDLTSNFNGRELRDVERGRDLRVDYKMVARALTRKGTALVKIAKCSEDYDIAIETFQKALTERRNPDTLKKLNDAEKAKKDLEQQEYFDPKIADEEREKGNEFFKQMKYPEAIKQYSEAIRRNPNE